MGMIGHDVNLTFYRSIWADAGLPFEGVWKQYGEPTPALREPSHCSTRFYVRSNEFTQTIEGGDRIECDGKRYTVLKATHPQPGSFRQLIDILTVAHA